MYANEVLKGTTPQKQLFDINVIIINIGKYTFHFMKLQYTFLYVAYKMANP